VAYSRPRGYATDNQKFAEYGPQATTLLIDIYHDYPTAWAMFTSSIGFDIMDWPIMPANLAGILTNTKFTWTEVNLFNLFEYDLNDQVMPTDIPAFRDALSYLINKDYFINYYSGLSSSVVAKADSPIASCTGYYNPACTNLYELATRTTLGDLYPYTPTNGQDGPDDYLDMLNAYKALMVALGPPVWDPKPSGAYGTYMWNWTTPYPYPAPSGDLGSYTVPNGHLLVFARSDDLVRATQGWHLRELLQEALPNWIAANYATLTALPPPYTLPAGCTSGADIHVDVYVSNPHVCFDQAMSAKGPNEYYYNVYTGDRQLGRDPDSLQYYTSQYSSTVVSIDAHNYGGFMDPKFDRMILGIPDQPNTGLLVTAKPDGSSTFTTINSYGNTVANATYWAYQAQLEMMQPSECALIPMWYTWHGFEGCLSNDTQVVNEVGAGLNNWYTFLNAYNSAAGTPGYWEPAGQFSWGTEDWTTGNPITATSMWDWNVLNEIYDPLIRVNPYNMSNDLPYIADNWTIGTWNAGATPNNELSSGICTTITFSLREDVFWQDMPAGVRNGITWNVSTQLNAAMQGVPFTPVDVAFTIMYLRDLDRYDTTENGYLVDGVVDHVIMNPVWQSLWDTCLNPSGIPVWFNTTAIDTIYGATFPDGSPLTWTRTDITAAAGGNVQFSTSVDPESIEVCFTGAMGWLGLHRVGSDLPIIPFHIWSQIAQDSWSYNGVTLPGAGWFDPEPSAYNVLYGTGPYILISHIPTVSFTLIANQAGASYGGITETVGYFWNSPVRTQDVSPSSAPNVGGTANGGDTEMIYWKQGTNTLWYTPGVMVNKDPTYPVTVSVQCWLDYLGWNPTLNAWVRLPGQTGPNATSTSTGIVIPANGTAQVWEHSAALTFPSWCSYIDVWEAYEITVTASPGNPCPVVGRISFGGDFYAGSPPYTPLTMMFSDNGNSKYYALGIWTEMININHLAGDIAGGETWAIPGEPTPAEPYCGSDGKVNLQDLMLVAFNWGKRVSWSGNLINPTDPAHRADITGSGTVGISDLMAVAFHWTQSWKGSSGTNPYGIPPRDPTPAEMALLGQFP
jgi:hypothetical protein